MDTKRLCVCAGVEGEVERQYGAWQNGANKRLTH